jgi:hypothetical protein
MMRFYNQAHRFYAGVDLHARTLAVCILDQAGAVVFEANLAVDPRAFLQAVARFRAGLAVACGCMPPRDEPAVLTGRWEARMLFWAPAECRQLPAVRLGVDPE